MNFVQCVWFAPNSAPPCAMCSVQCAVIGFEYDVQCAVLGLPFQLEQKGASVASVQQWQGG